LELETAVNLIGSPQNLTEKKQNDTFEIKEKFMNISPIVQFAYFLLTDPSKKLKLNFKSTNT